MYVYIYKKKGLFIFYTLASLYWYIIYIFLFNIYLKVFNFAVLAIYNLILGNMN